MASGVIPTIRYDDSVRMIAWLVDVFGFKRRMVIENDDGTVAHAELALGEGMVMVGQAHGEAIGGQTTARALGGVTQSAYLVVPDPDAVYARVKAAGAEIVLPNEDKDYGGRGFSCRDPEGQLWSVGDYDPWAAPAG